MHPVTAMMLTRVIIDEQTAAAARRQRAERPTRTSLLARLRAAFSARAPRLEHA